MVKKSGIKVKRDRRGYIKEITNPKGTKKTVHVAQVGDYTGYTAYYPKSHRKVDRGRKMPTLLKRLSKKHKKIRVLD